MKWTRRDVDQALAAGDVIYVEPMEDKPDQFRLRQIPEMSGAIVAMDPNTGRVHAMVGGFSFDQSEFNRAKQAHAPAGLVVQAVRLRDGPRQRLHAVEHGARRADRASTWVRARKPGRPRTTTASRPGPRTLRYGIEHSKNLMTVRLAKEVGMPARSPNTARRFGVYDDMLPCSRCRLAPARRPSMRMTAAYSMFVNGGKRIKPTLIDRIQDRAGRRSIGTTTANAPAAMRQSGMAARAPAGDNREQVIDPLTAYQMTSILEGVVQRGTAQSVKVVGKPLAGKTGTTNDAKDVWFVGFSPDLAVGVFIGYDKPQSLGNAATAGQYAAPVFRDFMQMALKDKPATPFRVPARHQADPRQRLDRTARRIG